MATANAINEINADLFTNEEIEIMEFEQELIDSLREDTDPTEQSERIAQWLEKEEDFDNDDEFEDDEENEEISFCQFCGRFTSINREHQFSYEAKQELYKYLTDDEIVDWSYINDPIAICCDWSEYDYDSAANDYSSYLSLEPEYDDDEKIEERHQAILEGLQDQTSVIEISIEILLIKAF